MGNTQIRDRHCGKFPPPTIHKHNIIACVREQGEEKDDSPQKQQPEVVVKSLPSTPPRPSTTGYVLKTIKTTLRDIWDPPEPERLPPKRFAPKHMLYGCNTTDEHFDYIEEMCDRVADLHGKEGLDVMGFEFRVVHHTKTCNCPDIIMAQNDDDLTDSEADEEELKEGYMESSEEGDLDGDDEYGQFSMDDSSYAAEAETKQQQESFLVPIGSPLKEQAQLQARLQEKLQPTKLGSSARESSSPPFSPPPTSSSAPMSRNTSTLSLFSLATHNTDFSNPTAATTATGGGRRGRSSRPTTTTRFPLATISSAPNVFVMEQDSCALRLHHVASNTMITAENHLQFMADGKFYDELARLCMEYSQQVMMEECGLEWTTVDEAKQFGAIVNKDFLEQQERRKQTLLIITGKGQVKAGIFSRRHLLVTSMEAATALPFIRNAQERNMNIVLLDPNCLGYRNGMDVVEQSLDHLFLNNKNDNEEVYVLAHSMAGAQLVRYFANNPSSYNNSRPPTPASCASSVSDGTTSNGSSGSNHGNNNNNTTTDTAANLVLQKAQLLQRVKAFAFTDSNHNINWTRNYPELTKILTGPPSLYIKSHKVHEKAKQLGETHHDCQFWRHRFGEIKTLWAGTHEHALTNYTARAHIWEHFDVFLNAEGQESEQQQQQSQQSQQESSTSANSS